jgi:hypothetical protein
MMCSPGCLACLRPVGEHGGRDFPSPKVCIDAPAPVQMGDRWAILGIDP